MRQLTRAAVLALALWLALPGAALASIKIHPAGSRIDLLLIGYAVFQTNLAEDTRGFFDSSDQLPAEFSNRQVLNLRLDGKLGASTTLDARLLHDKESLRDWRYRVALTGSKSMLALGENDGAFRETQFTRYDTPYYGVEGRATIGAFTSSAFATARSGSYRVDRLRGTNLSGPYILSASPVLEGSERVAIEVRDRRDEERVLSTDFKSRGRDYTIDYPTGTLLFDEPIEAETFDGNPIVVLIEYQYDLPGGSGSKLIGGARLEFQPMKGMKLGSTWMRASGGGSSALATEGVVGFDHTLALGKWLTFEGELAGPGGRPLDRDEGALRLGASVKPLGGLEVTGRFRRVGLGFDTTANPRLDTELDRQDWELDTSFVASPVHRFSAGFGVKSDNVAGDLSLSTTRTRIWFAGWEARPRHLPLLRLRYENRNTAGEGAFGGGSSQIDSITFDSEGKLGTLGPLGESAFKVQYRFEDTHDKGAIDDARRSHFWKARLDSRPAAILETFVEWRETRTAGQGGSMVRSVTHELLGGGRVRVGKTLAAGGSLRWRQNVDDIASEGSSTRTTAIFDARWEPSDRLRAVLKYEFTLLAAGDEPGARTQNLFGHIAVRPVRNLTLSLGSKLDDRGDETSGLGGLDGEWFASLLYKKGERLTFFARAEQGRSEERLPPFESTLANRRTWLLGSQVGLGRGWGTMAELKDERLRGAVAGHRRAIVLELSRALGKFVTLAGGIEFTLDQQGDTSRLDRERAYLKLVGRL